MSFLGTDLEHLGAAKFHFNAFADAFLHKTVANRWQTLFAAATESKWRKIAPWVLWEEYGRRSGARFVDISVPVENIRIDPGLCPMPDSDAVVIALGHSRAGVLVKRFSLLTASDWPLEGLISLEPGKRVFVKNHDGDVVLCTS